MKNTSEKKEEKSIKSKDATKKIRHVFSISEMPIRFNAITWFVFNYIALDWSIFIKIPIWILTFFIVFRFFYLRGSEKEHKLFGEFTDDTIKRMFKE